MSALRAHTASAARSGKASGPDGRFNVGGAFAGGVTGTNVQAGAFVFGVESEWMWSGARGSAPCHSKLRISTRAGRAICRAGSIGCRCRAYARVLSPLIAGSFMRRAVSHWPVRRMRSPRPNDLRRIGTDFRELGGSALHTGYLAGIGIEYAFLGNWSAKVEYNYIHFRPQSFHARRSGNHQRSRLPPSRTRSPLHSA